MVGARDSNIEPWHFISSNDYLVNPHNVLVIIRIHLDTYLDIVLHYIKENQWGYKSECYFSIISLCLPLELYLDVFLTYQSNENWKERMHWNWQFSRNYYFLFIYFFSFKQKTWIGSAASIGGAQFTHLEW